MEEQGKHAILFAAFRDARLNMRFRWSRSKPVEVLFGRHQGLFDQLT